MPSSEPRSGRGRRSSHRPRQPPPSLSGWAPGRRLALATFWLGATAAGPSAWAQTAAASGFALERFVPAPAGSAWLSADDLAWDPGWGGAVSLVSDYARDPLVLELADRRLTVVSDELVAHLGLAVHCDRFRLAVDLPTPLWLDGYSGALAGVPYAAPAFDPGHSPDVFADPAVGLSARLLGEPAGHHRLGVTAQLFVPSGERAAYLSDGSYRARLLLHYASELGPLRAAGQFGVHARPLDEATAGSPRGSEFLFTEALGVALPDLPGFGEVVGLELLGATAFNAFLGSTTTLGETLLTGGLETRGRGPQLRFKIGLGSAFKPEFGGALWRAVLGVELFDRGELPR